MLVTFLAEALATVLADVRLLVCVQLHVVPQGAGVGQQLGAQRALHLQGTNQITCSPSSRPPPPAAKYFSPNWCSGGTKTTPA